tara:strand:+ start:35061 stop:35507 length:447 start_codon:yes stop_codon:yes gene_type:complete
MTHQIKYNSFTPKVVYLTMSADQNSISNSATTVQFDTVTGDSGHGISISSNLITLTGGRHYWGFGCVVIDRSTVTDSQYTKFYDSSNNLLSPSSGYFESELPGGASSDSRVFQLSVSPSSNESFYIKTENADGDILSDGTHFILIEMS